MMTRMTKRMTKTAAAADKKTAPQKTVAPPRKTVAPQKTAAPQIDYMQKDFETTANAFLAIIIQPLVMTIIITKAQHKFLLELVPILITHMQIEFIHPNRPSFSDMDKMLFIAKYLFAYDIDLYKRFLLATPDRFMTTYSNNSETTPNILQKLQDIGRMDIISHILGSVYQDKVKIWNERYFRLPEPEQPLSSKTVSEMSDADSESDDDEY